MLTLIEGQTCFGPDDRYRYLSRIGSGTFAILLRAQDTITHQLVAIKWIRQPSWNMIGEREARLLKQLALRDPMNTIAIVRVMDTFLAHNGSFCMVLELLGHSMHQYTTKQDEILHLATMPRMFETEEAEPQHKLYAFFPFQQQKREMLDQFNTIVESTPVIKIPFIRLSLSQIKLITIQLCAALAFLHDQGVIHADIKPDNIVHTAAVPHGSVKLVDFGNCVEQRQIILYEEEDTDGGYPIQTLLYRAPEVATGLKISPAMDMWSLGCVLAECVTSTSLFTSRIHTEDNNTTAWTQDLVEQIEWLVTGGIPLRQYNDKYRAARYYKKKNYKKEGLHLRPTLPLRHRLVQARQEWRENCSGDEREVESEDAWALFDDFVTQLLDIDPDTRLTPRSAFLHPFLQSYFPFRLVFAPNFNQQEIVPIDTSCIPIEKKINLIQDGIKGKKYMNRKQVKKIGMTRKNGTKGLQEALKLIVPTVKIKEENIR